MIRDDLQSKTINVLRIVLIGCVVLVHSYTATRVDIDTSQYPVYRFVSFLISLNIAQIAIPGFFFISGYLHFLSSRSYAQQVHRDWLRLGIPYILWNGLMIAAYWGLECIPQFGSLFSGDNLPIHQYSFSDMLRAFWDCRHWDGGDGTPLLHQFWYIRNLIILGLLSPLIRLFVRHLGIIGIAALILWWVLAPGQGMIAKSVAFYTFGAWFSIRNENFLPLFRRHSRTVAIAYIALIITIMCFWDYPWSVWLNRANQVLGIVFFVGMIAHAIEKKMHFRSPAYIPGLTFFIYATHDPLIILVKRLMLRMAVPLSDASITGIYFLSAIMVVAICTASYFLLKRLFPTIISLLDGDRSQKKSYA